MEKGARRVAVVISNFRKITDECIKRLQQVKGIKIVDFGEILNERVSEECLAIDGTKTTVESGRLLSEDLVKKTLKYILRKPEYMEGLIVLIGYPRTVLQLNNLTEHFKYLHGEVSKKVIFLRPDLVVEQDLAQGYYCEKCDLTDYHYFSDIVKDPTCIFCGSELVLKEKGQVDKLRLKYNDYKTYTKEICRRPYMIDVSKNFRLSIITVENIHGDSINQVVEEVKKELAEFQQEMPVISV